MGRTFRKKRPYCQPSIDQQRTAWEPEWSDKQALALAVLAHPAIREVAYGGAKNGGKTFLGCRWVAIRAMEIIRDCSLRTSDHPPVVGFMGRKRAVDFHGTTLKTWYKAVPGELWKEREGDREMVICGAATVAYGGLDDTDRIKKFNSAEYGLVFLDQAEETSIDDVAELRVQRCEIGGNHIAPKALYTFNPATCWVRDQFVTNPAPNQRFIQALPTDNPWRSASYLDDLRKAYEHRPEVYEAYALGRMDVFDDPHQLIREAWVYEAKGRRFYSENPAKLVVCDVARFGDDETVIYDMEDTRIVGSEIYGKKETMHTVNRLFVRSHSRGDCLIVVDEGGVGGGIVDRLVEMGCPVLAIDSGKASSDKGKWANLRAEMWDNASKMFARGEVALDATPELAKQLCSPCYRLRPSEVLVVENKDEIKKRLGRSPDHADAYILGLHGSNFLARNPYWRQTDSVVHRAAADKVGVSPWSSYNAIMARYDREHPAGRARRWA